MKSKLLAPFKDFPQQFPLFKKSIYKLEHVPMASFNSVYGVPNDIICTSYDNKMNLLALSTKNGEVKIYGSSGLISTLVDNPVRRVNLLKFIDGQARIILIYDNDIAIVEYKRTHSIWFESSCYFEASRKFQGKVTAFDINHPLPWERGFSTPKELLIFGSEKNVIQEYIVDGKSTDIDRLNEFTIDLESLLSKYSDLPKDYDIGSLVQIIFNPSNDEQVYFTFKNGLVLILEFKNTLTNVTIETEVPNSNFETAKEVVDIDEETNRRPSEKTDENISPKTDNNADTEKENELIDKGNESVVKTDCEVKGLESEKEKFVEATSEKPEDKEDNKKFEETTELSDASVKVPKLLNYIVRKKINSICWLDNKIIIVGDDSVLINIFEVTGDGTKLSEPQQIITITDNVYTIITKVTFFKLNGENMGIFITSENDKQNLLILTKNDKLYSEIETPSEIIDYIIVKSPTSDNDETEMEPRILLIICKSQLIAIDLHSEDLSEIQCPYLRFQNTSRITSLTGIIQVPGSLFANARTVNEVFKDWPLKSPVLPNEKIDESTTLDIFGTGHEDGSICVWQVMQSGVLSLLIKVESTFLFKSNSDKLDSSPKMTSIRIQVGHRLIETENVWLSITNIQLILHDTSDFADSSSNELFCIVGTASGTVLVFKFDGSDTRENITEINCILRREDVNWMYVDHSPDFVIQPDLSDIGQKLPNLRSIIKICPSMPVTSLAFQPAWEVLGIGSTFGLALVDMRKKKCVFTHLTIQKNSRNDATSLSLLSLGEQFKNSLKQSFKKIKQLKLSTKHKSTMNEDKPMEKEEDKLTERDEEKEPTKPEEKKEDQEAQEIIKYTNIVEEKIKEEIKDEENNDSDEAASSSAGETEIIVMYISTKDRPSTTIGSLLIVNTSLTTTNKTPCLFAGTNTGAIYAFEISFEKDDNITVRLSKELHLQHKAPILSMEIINSNHVPLITPSDKIGFYQRKFKLTDKSKDNIEKTEINSKCESKNNQGVQKVDLSEDFQNKDVDQVENAALGGNSCSDDIIISKKNTRKSGTLPASFFNVIGKYKNDSHELLVVSEEQVKIFQLPSLKPKYKYKLLDTQHLFNHPENFFSQEPELQRENSEIQNESVTSKKNVQKILSVGLCKMLTEKSKKKKWIVLIARTNGDIVGLQCNNLKTHLSNIFNYSTKLILAGVSNGELNLITSYTNNHNIQVTDCSQLYNNRYEPPIRMVVSDDVRIPGEEENCAVDDDEKTTNNEIKPTVDPQYKDIGDNKIVEEHHMEEENAIQITDSTHLGDMTMDAIKEYITNVDDNITIQTFESSNEKQITTD